MRNFIKKMVEVGLVVFALINGAAHAQTAAKLSDYWSGNAQWDLVGRWTEAEPNGASPLPPSKIRILNGTWYMFQREFIAPSVGNCPNGQDGKPIAGLAIRIYKSTNQGRTWQSTSGMISPQAGTSYSCMVADGDAVYDSVTSKWRALFQCLGVDGVWRACYFESSNAALSTSFTYVRTFQPGFLWGKICKGTANCPTGMGDEGTFDIFRKDTSGYFWVTFHGYKNSKGYRGIAKTTDFNTWVAGTAGLPTDSSMSSANATTWREAWNSGGNKGAGAGSGVDEDGYTYQLVEFADIDLSCTPGQHWDVGLFRTTDLASTNWQQLPQGNPIIYSSTAPEQYVDKDNNIALGIRECNVQYAQLIQDMSVSPVVVYMKVGRITSDKVHNGVFLYRLNKSTNLLKNANLWMADGSYWGRLPSGASTPNLAVYRQPNQSPDANQFLATNCIVLGSSCTAGSSILQDVAVGGMAGRTVTFGGLFATAGGNGAGLLALLQLDSSYNILRSDAININAGPPAANGSYASFTSAPVTIVAGASVLRYQFYHGTPGITYQAGKMFVNLQ
jgi:hypothetical protein